MRDDYHVAYAADGEAAIKELGAGTFAIVILDLKIPKITGFEVLKHIKANVPSTKVIVLTAYADLKNVEAVKQLGADDVIEKPYEMGELFDAIEFVLKR